jgi:GNAT superfamily N-acetyltransferase
VGAIARFQTVCWRETYRGLVPQDYLDRVGVSDREVRWRHRLLTADRRVALAADPKGLVGVVSWADASIDDGPELELKSLYVAAEYHGVGVATRLLARALGSAPAHLWVFEGNVRAHAFYRKHGFDFDGHRTIDPDTGVPEQRMSRS